MFFAFCPTISEGPMTRVQVRRVARFLTIGVLGAFLMAAPANAAPLTLNFEGTLTMSGSGELADFSGFFTWDPLADPDGTEGTESAFYAPTAYELILDGVSQTHGSGLIVGNDGPGLEPGVLVDGLIFLASLDNAPSGNPVFFVAALFGPTSMWDSTALPGDLNFLTSLTTTASLISEEVPEEGDDNDIVLGQGTLKVTVPITTVPEPATLLLMGSGLAAVGLRRARQRR
jgi:hypothetical protein